MTSILWPINTYFHRAHLNKSLTKQVCRILDVDFHPSTFHSNEWHMEAAVSVSKGIKSNYYIQILSYWVISSLQMCEGCSSQLHHRKGNLIGLPKTIRNVITWIFKHNTVIRATLPYYTLLSISKFIGYKSVFLKLTFTRKHLYLMSDNVSSSLPAFHVRQDISSSCLATSASLPWLKLHLPFPS